MVCTIVGVDTIGAVASYGAEAFTWLIVLAVVFFIPSALLSAELGTAFPEEGGPYVWTRLAFGRLAGAVNNFLYWVTNPVWLGGTLAVSRRRDLRRRSSTAATTSAPPASTSSP